VTSGPSTVADPGLGLQPPPCGKSPDASGPLLVLRRVARLEGVSFLVLLGIAMPLKHFAGMPLAVAVLGWIHGSLFVVFCCALVRAVVVARLSSARAAVVFVAALLPFGPFAIDSRLVAWEEAMRRERGPTPGP